MGAGVLLFPIVLPILGGALIPLFRFRSSKARELYVEGVVIMTSLLVLAALLLRPEGTVTVFRFGGAVTAEFGADGLGMVFAGLVAFLWPFATLYAFEYMKHEGGENTFFTFFTMTYGVTVGIAFAGNYMTMYMFYEMLTLVTLPLVMHGMKKAAVFAGRRYLFYSIGGAAFAFIGFIFVLNFGTTSDFRYGGVFLPEVLAERANLYRVIYVLAIFGFGVKAAVFPLHRWLPTASVAPTPVTALLHAVAVVNAGAFAIIRITYYSFGTEFLRGSFAQNILMGAALVTILFGSAMALKEQHLKRRLAYSTVSNLSYILFSASIMTQAGLVGAMTHMIFHGLIKITLFFCAGSILYRTGKEYVYELTGFGKKMPVVMGCFTAASLGLIGIPPLAGFVSKWNIGTAAMQSGNGFACIGVGVLLVSALLTACYLMTTVVRAYFPRIGFNAQELKGVSDPNWRMKLPLIVFTVFILAFGLFSAPLVRILKMIAEGVAL